MPDYQDGADPLPDDDLGQWVDDEYPGDYPPIAWNRFGAY